MKLAIHKTTWTSFAGDWIAYCDLNQIPYKIVNCYDSDIIQQIEDCDALFFHYHHTLTVDVIFAKQLMYTVEQSGKIVFPNFNTGWHFDDKLGQKYLLEAIDAPLVPTTVFFSKKKAMEWAAVTDFPKVFKLRGGAGSTNVKLINSKSTAESFINQAFGRGFSKYDRWGDFTDNFQKLTKGKSSWLELLRSFRRLFVSTEFARTHGKEKGYVYFQKFIPNNDSDIRVITIGDKAFAIKRLVRDGDFRASGSGYILYKKEEIDERCIAIAFETTDKLNAQCVAYDFVFDETNNPLIVEINYGYMQSGYDKCPGYWDKQLNWHEGKFNSLDWIIENCIHQLKDVNY
jgi:glutathione synthase/RimK-type ligase-like ATP-grasp enzyme